MQSAAPISTSHPDMNQAGMTLFHRTRLAALVVLALATPAHAMVLCATRKGDLVADEQCRRREVQLDAQDLGVVGAAGLPGPAGPAGPDGASVERPFRVVDADGKPACLPVADDGKIMQCVLQPDADDVPIQLVLYRNGTDPEFQYAYYLEPGCRGEAFMTEPQAMIARGFIFGGRLLAVRDAREMRMARSYERPETTCNGGTLTADGTCCSDFASPVEENLAPARTIVLSTLGIAVPLHGEDR
jgi:hypothetical protein